MAPNPLRIGLLQMCAPDGSIDDAVSKGLEFCNRAKEGGADVVIFPEMWNNGYRLPAQAEDGVHIDSRYVNTFRDAANKLDIVIGLTFLESAQTGLRNTLALIDRRGEIALLYAKSHTCDFSKESQLVRGNDFPVARIDCGPYEVSMGAMICYDREFPEPARLLMLGGAELVIVPNACPMAPEQHRMDIMKVRSFENMMGIALANYAAPDQDGHSVAFSGMAFDEDGQPMDMLLTFGDTAEGIVMADFNVGELREYRERETWGNAYRRPSLYQPLSSMAVEPPFVRPDARR